MSIALSAKLDTYSGRRYAFPPNMLIFTMLGEASTTEISRNKDAQGYVENRSAAVEGGSVARRARRDLENKSGKRIMSKENYKQLPEAVARKKLKREK